MLSPKNGALTAASCKMWRDIRDSVESVSLTRRLEDQCAIQLSYGPPLFLLYGVQRRPSGVDRSTDFGGAGKNCGGQIRLGRAARKSAVFLRRHLQKRNGCHFSSASRRQPASIVSATTSANEMSRPCPECHEHSTPSVTLEVESELDLRSLANAKRRRTALLARSVCDRRS